MPVKLDLEPHEVTLILKGLDKLPRKEAEPLIKKIVHEDARQKMTVPGLVKTEAKDG